MHLARPHRTRTLLVVIATLAGGALMAPPVAAARPTATDGPEVTVLDPGDAPRTQLRYTVAVGTTMRTQMRMSTDVAQTVGGETRRASSPPITVTMSITVTAVDPDGTMHFQSRYDDVRVDGSGATADATAAAVGPMIGLTATSTVSPTGQVLETTVDIPAGVSDQLESLTQSLSDQAGQLSAPLPEEAVGRGARWRVATEVTSSGITLEQDTTYTLERVQGSVLTLSSELRQRGDRQLIEDPTTGTSVTLLRSAGTGSGRSTFDLALGTTAQEGAADVRIRQALRYQGRTLHQTLGIGMEISSSAS